MKLNKFHRRLFLKNFLKMLSSILKELPQIIMLLGLAIFVMWLSDWFPEYIGHPEFAPLFTCIYMVLFLGMFSHIIHRILFSKFDLNKFCTVALTSSIGAAIVILSVSIVLSVLIYSSTIMLH